MPLLSVVVPVHGVAPYVEQCITSVLRLESDQIELIAVDDASTDGSDEILARLAATDPRLTVLTNERNVGQSESRNIGLRRASGDFVWFVDGDDWLPDGAIERVLSALGEPAPDVVVMDFEVVHDDGSIERHVGVRGSLSNRADVLGSPHYVWNKVFRRELLIAEDAWFPPGWYEDKAFTVPVLLAASGIEAIHASCYRYRRRPGSSTLTVSDRHFEVFAQWERIFAYLDAHPAHDALRPAIHQHMMMVLLTVLKLGRVPRARRREYFGEVRRFQARYRPAGPAKRAPKRIVVDWLVAAGAYRTYVAGERALDRLAGLAARARRRP